MKHPQAVFTPILATNILACPVSAMFQKRGLFQASRSMIHSTSGAGMKRQLRRGPAMTLR